MNPHKLSSALRNTASALYNSRSPSREMVVRDLNNLVTRISVHMFECDCGCGCKNQYQNDSAYCQWCAVGDCGGETSEKEDLCSCKCGCKKSIDIRSTSANAAGMCVDCWKNC